MQKQKAMKISQIIPTGIMNATIIFQTALMDKMYDNQDYDGMSIEDRMKMAESCGLALRKLIHTYTGLDTHKVEEFL